MIGVLKVPHRLWLMSQASSNLKVAAVGAQEISGKDGDWKVSEKANSEDHDQSMRKNAVYQSGEGKYQINIDNAYSVSLNSNQ